MAGSKRATLIIQVMEGRLRLMSGRSSLSSSEVSEFTDITADVRLGGGEEKEFANTLFKEIERFLHRTGLRNPQVVVALARTLLVWRYFRVPPVLRENLDSLVDFEVEKHLPVRREDIYYQCLPVAQGEEGWTILLAGTRRDFVRPIEEALEMMGLKPSLIIPDLFGLISLINRRGQDLENSRPVIAHMGDNALEVAVLSEGLPVAYRRIPLPEDPAPGVCVSASDLLTSRASAAAGAISAVLKEAAASPGPAGPFEPGVLCLEEGSGDLVIQGIEPGLVGEWQVIRLSDIAFLAGKTGLQGRLQHAAGLAVGADVAGSSAVNLLPSPPRQQPKEANLTVTAVLAVLLVAMACLFLLRVDTARRRQLAALDVEIKSYRAKVEAVMQRSNDVKREERILDSLNATATQRTLTVNILRELTKLLPQTAYLAQLTLKGNSLAITGFADSSSELIPKLEASPFFKNVAFEGSVTSQGQKERFNIKMNLK